MWCNKVSYSNGVVKASFRCIGVPSLVSLVLEFTISDDPTYMNFLSSCTRAQHRSEPVNYCQ